MIVVVAMIVVVVVVVAMIVVVVVVAMIVVVGDRLPMWKWKLKQKATWCEQVVAAQTSSLV